MSNVITHLQRLRGMPVAGTIAPALAFLLGSGAVLAQQAMPSAMN